MTSSHWTERIHVVCDTVVWMVKLNLWWVLFTLVGLVVVGIAPATVTAAIMVRRRAEHGPHRFADFAQVYRAELVRSQPVVLPVVVVLAVLAANYQWFSLLGPSATLPRLITLVALVGAGGAAAYVAPLYAHYDLPRARYARQALRIALARPLWTVILVFVAVVLLFVSARWPVLVGVISIGAWLHASSWLALRFFAHNEDRLRAPSTRTTLEDRAPERIFGLPVQPLRLR